jgi:glycosyltransferase involved in cell wall biosynthesis
MDAGGSTFAGRESGRWLSSTRDVRFDVAAEDIAPMRIAIFSDHFQPELGGIQDAVECLARGLAGRGHQIDLYVPRYSLNEYRKAGLPFKEVALHENISIHRQSSIPYRGHTQQTRLALPLYAPISLMKQRRPDIIHSHTVFGLGLSALAAARFWEVPLVATYHMAMAVYATYIPKAFVKNFAAYVKWYLNQADFVSAPAGFVFDEIGRPKPPHEVITNSIDTELFHPPAAATRATGDMRMIYAGKFTAEKRVDQLIRALKVIRATNPRVTLALAGHGDQQTALVDLVQELDLEGAVDFVGTLNKAALADAYRGASVFVTMSSSEVQSISQMQAMACGLPVVCARSECQPASSDPTKTGIISVPPNSVDAFARTILRLAAKPNMLRQMSARAASFCDAYTISSVSAQWESRYMDVVRNHPLRAPTALLGGLNKSPRRATAMAGQRSRERTAVLARIFSRDPASSGVDADVTLNRPKWSKTR